MCRILIILLRSEHFFFRLLGTHPGVFTRGSLFNAGQTMVFLQVSALSAAQQPHPDGLAPTRGTRGPPHPLQSLGLTTRDISAHIIPKAPEVLLQDFSRLEPVTAYFCAPPAPDGGDDAATATNPGDGSTADGGALHPPAMETWPQSQLEQQQQGPAQEPWGVSRGREGGGGAGSGQRGGLGLSHDQLRSLLSRCVAAHRACKGARHPSASRAPRKCPAPRGALPSAAPLAASGGCSRAAGAQMPARPAHVSGARPAAQGHVPQRRHGLHGGAGAALSQAAPAFIRRVTHIPTTACVPPRLCCAAAPRPGRCGAW